MDFLISQSDTALNRLPLEKRAQIPGGLPDKLSLMNIAKLSAIGDPTKEKATLTALIDLCKKGEIKYYGNIKGWEWGGSGETFIVNPYPEVLGFQVEMGNPLTTALYNKYRAAPADCLIHRRDFENYLKSIKKWPVKGILANWWSESKSDNSEKEDPDYLRTKHAKEWVKKNEYKGGKPDIKIIEELRREKSDLWGKNESTFRKWIQLDEAKSLFPNTRRRNGKN